MNNTLESKFQHFLASPENKELLHAQQELLNRLFAYFQSVYQVLHIEHPSSHAPIIVWMTQDVMSPDNTFQGPIPLLYNLPEKWIVYDYRELNDQRDIFQSGSESVLGPALRILLQQPIHVLTQIIQRIDARMTELQDEQKLTKIIDDLEKWERAVGYDKSIFVEEASSHDNKKALQRLSELYFQNLNEK